MPKEVVRTERAPRPLGDYSQAWSVTGARLIGPVRGLVIVGALVAFPLVVGVWLGALSPVAAALLGGSSLLLAWRLRRENALQDFDPYPMVMRAAGYLIRNGPATQQERWEEAGGASSRGPSARLRQRAKAASQTPTCTTKGSSGQAAYITPAKRAPAASPSWAKPFMRPS